MEVILALNFLRVSLSMAFSSLEAGRFISFFVEGNGEKNPAIHQVQGKSFGIYQLCIRIMGSIGIVFPHPALFSLFILNACNARKRVQVI